ncbi:permease of the major facilitator superfamily protein [Thermococcus sp. 4557]|uniref:MFS transporter n=1 Tax=Thermococcus sp. (strain CGMCC 1.5172 / 4557) TaxID=1042877 RepID=UPI000219ED0A|nr:MFS transporter [Thermococcus sp. 4557]AEK72948.1 permease of the major facilitator superfamily protein [Thermococcus sp. 4557]
MSLQNYRGFGRDAWLLVAYSFASAFGGNIAWFIFPFYLKSLGFDYTNIGVVFSLSTLAQAAVLLFSGPFGARVGYKRTVLLGVSMMFLGRLVQVLHPTLWMLALGGVLIGIGMALESPSFMALLSGEVEDGKRHYLFSLSSGIGTIASALGILVAGFLSRWLSYGGVFSLVLVVIPIRFAIVLFVRPVLERHSRGLNLDRSLLVRIGRFALPGALIGLGAGIAIPYMGLWFNQRFGTSLESIGWLFAFQQFIMGIGMFLLPMIADRFGSVKTIVSFNGTASLLIGALPFSPAFPVAAVIYILRTILMNIVNPIWNSFMMGFFEEEERSTAMALNSLAWTATFGVGQYVGGVLFDMSLVWPFLITAFLYSLSMVVFWGFFGGAETKGYKPPSA